MNLKGTVIKSTGVQYWVRLEDTNEILICRIRGKFRLEIERVNNPITVGDWVHVSHEDNTENQGVITEILPRKNYVVRESTSKKHQLHLLASNVDQSLLVATIHSPFVKLGFIDRFILTNETQNIPTILVFNKADIYEDVDIAYFEEIKQMYEKIGYTVFLVSAFHQKSIEPVREALKNKITMISGHSGVGKSSLVNVLQPHLVLETQDLSAHSGKGMHTTTFAEMHALDFGGYIIDTPGIKELGFINLTKQELAHNYKDFFEMSANCRFGADCLHLDEPNCAVKQGLEDGVLHIWRYQSYLSVMEEVQSQKYWQIKK
jgi:ribosome biogenesis GTPase